ncbi:hypothetical protein HAX54_009458 [Datura stramonium]|uniref:Uncharacterized protein n=1 Tax=Datura stramonium TaxID=4076 RepID=A0ABS8TFQ5_DATST|nr:hypothetical protein [Datura stramonium]
MVQNQHHQGRYDEMITTIQRVPTSNYHSPMNLSFFEMASMVISINDGAATPELEMENFHRVPHGAKEKVPDNPKGSNPQNPKEKGPQNPNDVVPQNPKQQVVANTSPLHHGSLDTIETVSSPLPHGSPISVLAVGVVRGKVYGQEDVRGGLVGGKENPIEPISTPSKRQIIPAIQKDIDEANHFIYDHPQYATGGQNISYDQTLDSNTETPPNFQNPTSIACDPPDPVFAVCNLNTLGSKDFDAHKYRQTFGATTSQMSDAQVKEFTDQQGLSPRAVSHFSPGSRTGPPATRTRLRVKTH